MSDLPPDVEEAIARMDPDEKVRAAIRVHLVRQRLVALGYVKLDTGAVVQIGEHQ